MWAYYPVLYRGTVYPGTLVPLSLFEQIVPEPAYFASNLPYCSLKSFSRMIISPLNKCHLTGFYCGIVLELQDASIYCRPLRLLVDTGRATWEKYSHQRWYKHWCSSRGALVTKSMGDRKTSKTRQRAWARSQVGRRQGSVFWVIPNGILPF